MDDLQTIAYVIIGLLSLAGGLWKNYKQRQENQAPTEQVLPAPPMQPMRPMRVAPAPEAKPQPRPIFQPNIETVKAKPVAAASPEIDWKQAIILSEILKPKHHD